MGTELSLVTHLPRKSEVALLGDKVRFGAGTFLGGKAGLSCTYQMK